MAKLKKLEKLKPYALWLNIQQKGYWLSLGSTACLSKNF